MGNAGKRRARLLLGFGAAVLLVACAAAILAPRLSALLALDPVLPTMPVPKHDFYRGGVDAPEAGTKLRNPELADTLRVEMWAKAPCLDGRGRVSKAFTRVGTPP